jgi:hypothetical protein
MSLHYNIIYFGIIIATIQLTEAIFFHPQPQLFHSILAMIELILMTLATITAENAIDYEKLERAVIDFETIIEENG